MAKKNEEAIVKADKIEALALTNEQTDQAHFLGLLQGARELARGLDKLVSAQVVNALDQFQKEERYKLFGHLTFVEFLNQSAYSPMKKDEYYDRKALLEKEGESTYDALNALNLPVYRRKALPPGAVRVEGEFVVLGGEDGEERIPITEGKRLKQVLKALTDANVAKEEALTAAQKKLERSEKAKADAEAEVEELHTRLNEAGDPLTQGIEPSGLVLGIAQLEQGFRTLEGHVKDTKPSQKEIDDLCERLERRLNAAFRAFGFDVPQGL
jgi:hypothetical protein